MEDAARAGDVWSDREIELVVADYFDMLALELRGEPYVKSQRNAALRALTGRSRASIEFKHQNISAVLQALVLPWIRGYKPRVNYQHALSAAIEHHLERIGPSLLEAGEAPSVGVGLQDALGKGLYIEPPPSSRQQESALPAPMRRLVRKFDPAARDARNRDLGRRGEELVYLSEREALSRAGRGDLARKVRWVSDIEGDGAGYDILSFDPSGAERLIEVKTTTGGQFTPFFLSENERSLAEERSDAFRLRRLYDFSQQPRAFDLVPPLEGKILLRPVSYRASF
ncbi:MAG: DUF3883 domain-containing protein [Ferrovibrionaceae bacterium]